MGAQYSHLELETLTPWCSVQFGLHYNNQDLAIWPQFYPLAMCFTANDAISLRDALRHRPQTSLLTIDEFMEWLQTNKSASSTSTSTSTSSNQSQPPGTSHGSRRFGAKDGIYFQNLMSPAPQTMMSRPGGVPAGPMARASTASHGLSLSTANPATNHNGNSNNNTELNATGSNSTSNSSNSLSCSCSLTNSSQLLDSYVEFIFESMKCTVKSSHNANGVNPHHHKVFAMEFLAAMTIISKPIWRLEDKIRLLIQLFEQRFVCRFRLGDLVQMFFCVMQGIAKVTVGVAQVWQRHEMDMGTIAKELAVECLASVQSPRKKKTPGTGRNSSSMEIFRCFAPQTPEDLESASDKPIDGMTSDQVQKFFLQKRVVHRFLSLFSGEEVRNPWSFSTLRSASGLCVNPEHFHAMRKQQQMYLTWLVDQKKTSLYGRLERRQQHAAILIQSCWRRKFSKMLMEQKCREQLEMRHQSAKTLQTYVKHRNMSKLLSRHAFVEKCAYNGGILVTGTGACIGRKPRKLKAKYFPLELIDYFKFREKKCTLLAMSKNHAIALDDKGHQLYAWGKSLPCAISSIETAAVAVAAAGTKSDGGEEQAPTGQSRNFLTRPVPVPLVVTGIPVKQLACGLSHCLLLDQYGMLYSWGFNDHGQTGHGPSRIFQARKRLMTHRTRPIVRQQSNNSNGPGNSGVGLVKHLAEEEVSATPTGYLSYYDPKLGVEYEYLDRPVRLLYFEGSPQQQADPIPLKQICCGDYYSMALSLDGEVFCWGEASEGQLGLGVMDTSSQLEVGFCDNSLVQSAFTFVPQPEPVVALSEESIVQICCNGNHSMALTNDSRIFEWGNWGKRKGKDLEHVFEPIEVEQVKHLRLTKLAAGEHHTIAEGSSVWLRLDTARPKALNQPVQELYVALAKFACGFGEILKHFCGKQLVCTVIDNDLDDLDAEPVRVERLHDDVVLDSWQDAGSVKQNVWHQRIAPFALDFDAIGTLFDMKLFDLLPDCDPSTTKFSQLIDLLYTDQCNRLVVIPRGAQAGYYVQFVLPLPSSQDEATSSSASRTSGPAGGGAVAGVGSVGRPGSSGGRVRRQVVEFLTCPSKQAARLITKRGFGTHVAVFANDSHQEPSIADSLCLIWIDESCNEFVEAQNAANQKKKVHDCGQANTFRVPEITKDNPDHDEASNVSWGELLIQAIMHRVMLAQEMGAIAALVVLDFLDTDPFELDFDQESGVFIPVLMVKKNTVITSPRVGTTTSGPTNALTESTIHVTKKWPTFGRFYLDLLDPSRRGRQLQVRCFRRLDTIPFRIAKALEWGACGVLVMQDQDSVELDGETKGAPVFLASTSAQWEAQLQQSVQHNFTSFASCGSSSASSIASSASDYSSSRASSFEPETPPPLPFVGMLSFTSGESLRHACRLSERRVALSSLNSSCHELVAEVSLQIKPGGSLYAWGNGENGRLGLGPKDKSPFQDGYEAFTDSTYRFVDKPAPIPGLGGILMLQICCGSAHSIALTRDGKVFCWGKGKNGECGFAVPHDQWTPQQLHRLRYERIIQVAANDKCSAFVCETVPSAVYHQRRKEIAHLRAATVRQQQQLASSTNASVQ